MKKILFLTRLFYPHIGGVERHVMSLSRQLIEVGYSVEIITENHGWKQLETIEGIRIYRMPIGKNEFFKKFRIWYWLLRHKKLLLEADVIHCHDVFFWYFPFAVFFPLKNVYTTFHGYEGNSIPGFKAKLMHKIAEKMSNKNICVGQFLEKWYDTNANIITYGAVEIPRKEQQVKILSGKKMHFAFLGRLEEETGIMEYLKAVKLLEKEGYKILLTILGDGSLMHLVKDFVKEENMEAKILGFVKNPEEHIERAEIIFASRYLGILEALVQKKYVFAIYNNEIKKDYLDMTPFAKYISIARDAAELVEQFNSMVKDKKGTREKIEKAFLWAKEQTWKNLTKEYLTLWDF